MYTDGRLNLSSRKLLGVPNRNQHLAESNFGTTKELHTKNDVGNKEDGQSDIVLGPAHVQILQEAFNLCVA